MFMRFLTLYLLSFTLIIQSKQQTDMVYSLPKSVDEVVQVAEKIITECTEQLDIITNIPSLERNFDNTARALDDLQTKFLTGTNVLRAIESVHPDEHMRHIAHDYTLKLNSFGIDMISQNVKLYELFNAYVQDKSIHENLNQKQRYFLEQVIEIYHRNGLNLSNTLQGKLKEIQKQLSKHGLAFEKNIVNCERTIEVEQEELRGCSESFIAELEKKSNGKYILSTYGPSYYYVSRYCDVESTRETFWRAMNDRCYPENKKELERIVGLRNELAQLLGYKNFTDFDLANQMVKTSQAAKQFLQSVRIKAKEKANDEFESLKNCFTTKLNLKIEDTLQPWNLLYINERIPTIDHQVIAEYFPLNPVLNRLFSLCKDFLGIDIKIEAIENKWHDDVEYVTVYKDGVYLGSIFLDLYSRPNKFKTPRYLPIIPTRSKTIHNKVELCPSIGLIILSFPSKKIDEETLLYHSEVATLFHEFGHALHALLSKAEFGFLSATKVKRDFLEMPSQMMERWVWDPEILRYISAHYKTKKPLDTQLINDIVKSRYQDIGTSLCTQLSHSFQALAYYKESKQINFQEIYKEIYLKNTPYLAYVEDDHSYSNFWHLNTYGAKYYGYLWSEVFAADIFSYIKKNGLFNKEIWKKYTTLVLEPGATEDPEKMLEKFLGRKPTIDAFFKDLGFN